MTEMTWPSQPFGELYAEPSRNGLTRPKRVRGAGVKMVNMGELFAFSRLNGQEMDRVPVTESEAASFGLRAGDLLFARQSLIASGAGKCSIVLAVPEPTTFESHLIRVRLDPAKADPHYFYYYLSSPDGKGRVQSLVMQVAAAGIRGSELARLPVPIPPTEVQRRIASVLKAYDDLIENNTQRIVVLEEMTRLLYGEWFVNYRFPGHEGVEMVDSSFGPVPSGWSVMNLSQLVTTQYGYTESASTDVVGPKFLRGMDINKNSYIEWDSVPYCPIGERERDRYRLSKGDIVVIRMADPGKVGIVETDVDAVFASYLIRLSITSSLVRPHYLFYFLLSERYQDYVTGASTGTTRKSASAGVMTAIDVALPPEPLMNRFEEVIGDIRMALNALLGKNSVLRRTRDLLLPRLISGELGVSNLDINTRELSA